MIRREAVVACRRCFVTSQTVIKYGGYRQSNLILFGSCSCTWFLRGKKETKKNMASIFRASLRPFFRAVDQTFFPRSCPVRWKSASSQAQVKLIILRKRITNQMCSYIITSYSWLVFRIFCKVKVTVSTPYKNYEVMYFQNTTTRTTSHEHFVLSSYSNFLGLDLYSFRGARCHHLRSSFKGILDFLSSFVFIP